MAHILAKWGKEILALWGKRDFGHPWTILGPIHPNRQKMRLSALECSALFEPQGSCWHNWHPPQTRFDHLWRPMERAVLIPPHELPPEGGPGGAGDAIKDTTDNKGRLNDHENALISNNSAIMNLEFTEKP